MSRYGGASIFVYVDGYLFYPKSFEVEGFSETEDTTVIGDASKKNAPVGVSGINVAEDGAFFDDDTAALHTAMTGGLPTATSDTPRVLVCGFGADIIGAPFIGLEGDYTHGYKVISSIGKLTKANVQHLGDGDLDHGVVLQPLAEQTADWDTESSSVDMTTNPPPRVIPITSNSMASPSVVTTPVAHGLTTGDLVLISGVSGSDADINGEQTVTVISSTTFSVPVDASTSGGTGGQFVRADSSNGGVGYQEVSAVSGFTNFVGTIRDSPDDAAWADVASFADNVSAPYAERIEFAGQIDRYTAFSGNVTGSGTISAWAGLKRNP